MYKTLRILHTVILIICTLANFAKERPSSEVFVMHFIAPVALSKSKLFAMGKEFCRSADKHNGTECDPRTQFGKYLMGESNELASVYCNKQKNVYLCFAVVYQKSSNEYQVPTYYSYIMKLPSKIETEAIPYYNTEYLEILNSGKHDIYSDSTFDRLLFDYIAKQHIYDNVYKLDDLQKNHNNILFYIGIGIGYRKATAQIISKTLFCKNVNDNKLITNNLISSYCMNTIEPIQDIYNIKTIDNYYYWFHAFGENRLLNDPCNEINKKKLLAANNDNYSAFIIKKINDICRHE